MYILNGQIIDVNQPQIIGEDQYPAGWFTDVQNVEALQLQPLVSDPPPYDTLSQVLARLIPIQVDGVWTQQWSVTSLPLEEAQSNLAAAKVVKNNEINKWRLQANQSTFPYQGKSIGCDPLSRSDIDGVAGSISLFGSFPNNFPMAWKCADNTFISLPDVAAFKSMYSAMTDQGTITFNKSQQLKTALATATTKAEIDAIVWDL